MDDVDSAQPTQWTSILLVELLFLFLSAPFLYFPTFSPPVALYLGLGFLAGSWLWRRWRLGCWLAHSSADLPLFLFLLIVLLISLWVAPASLRVEYSIPRTYILLWNLSLFWMVVTYSSRFLHAGKLLLGGFALCTVGLAMLAPLGIKWLYKFPGLDRLLVRIPTPLQNIFVGAESGFHPNQVAGTLLYALPLFLALTVSGLRPRRSTWQDQLYFWLFAITALFATLVLLLTQSRAALLGFGIGCLIMILVPWPWGRRTLGIVGVGMVIALPFIPPSVVDLLGDTPPELIGGSNTLGFRQDVWTQALRGIYDFPLTGMGFGTFREVIWVLYPTNIPPTYNLGHAHNFFLQSALDFGIPGLVLLLALYILAAIQIGVIWRAETQSSGMMLRPFAVGLIGSFVAHLVYSQLDAVAMGAKTNFMFWYLFALIFGFANYVQCLQSRAGTHSSTQPNSAD